MIGLALLLGTAFGAAARLPTDVAPRHYELFFDVDPASGHFAGTVSIDLDVRAPVKQLVLNAVGLDLSDISVTQGESTAHPAPELRPADQEVLFAAPLAPGAARFHARFTAPLRKDLRGLYLAKTPDGEAWAATQFEPTDARSAFPCFDEPAFRATFTVRARIPDRLSAVSNGPLTADQVEIGGGHRVEFAETPPISSYLVALAVGRFGMISGRAEGASGAVPLRVITPAGQEQLGRLALQAAERIIPWYERYTGVPFPFAKLDMVAIPEFESGGMENAGAIFYRMSALLLDEAHASLRQRERVEQVVAHEIAHQWFGDLVTMRWWDNLWLNEAFASLMGYFCVRDLRPEWPVRQELAADVAHAKWTDSLRSTHAIQSPVADPAQADSQFDEITYVKGEGVLAMLANAVGDDAFQAGLHRYLTANAFGNARADDLFDALGEASGEPLTDLARAWITQVGLPIVAVHRRGGQLLVGQRRFTATPSKDDGTRWPIPFCVDSATPPGSVQKRVGECLTLSPTTTTVDVSHLEVSTAKDWVFANADGAGFYRVGYDVSMLAALTAALRGGGLTAEESISFLADLRALAWSGGKLAPALDASEALGAERDPKVVGELIELAVSLDDVTGTADRGPLSAWVRRRLGPLLTELGWEPVANERPERALLRAEVLDTLDRVGRDPAVAAEARRRVDVENGGGAELPPTLRLTLLTIAARHGDLALWNALLDRLKGTSVPELRQTYLAALMAFTAPDLVARNLALTLSETISAQDVGLALAALFSASETREAAWQFFQTNFASLKPRLPPLLLERRVLPSLGGFCSLDDRKALGAFFQAHPLAGAERPLDRALETVEICARAKPRWTAELRGWLARHGATATPQGGAGASAGAPARP